MARIFISYKRVDKDKVFKIKDQIESALGEKCWIDIDGIESDAQFKNVIINAINESEVVLFMYSEAHKKIIDFEKDWTIRELNFAQKKGKRIVFVNIDGSPLTDAFEFDYGTKQQVDSRDSNAINKMIVNLHDWLHIKDPEPENNAKTENKQRWVSVFQTFWLWLVFAIHTISIIILYALLSDHTGYIATLILVITATYGTWRAIKRKKHSFLIMCIGDISGAISLFFIISLTAASIFTIIVIFCLLFHWLAMNVKATTY